MPNIAHHHPRNELPKLEQQLSEEVFVIHAQLARRGTCCPREPTVQHFGGSVHLHCSGIVVCPMPLIAERRDWDVVCRGFLDEKTVLILNCRQIDNKPQCASMKSRNITGINFQQKRIRNRHVSLANFQFKSPTAAACLVFHWRTKQKHWTHRDTKNKPRRVCFNSIDLCMTTHVHFHRMV